MNIALIPNMTRKNTYNVTVLIALELAELGVGVFLEDSLKESFPTLSAVRFLASDSLFANCDFVIAIGGDGSIIHAAKLCVEYDKPILGINAGRLAFMAGLENNEIHLLSKLISGDYAVDKRMMLKVRLYKKHELIRTDCCLNDVVFTRGAGVKLTEYDVFCGNSFIDRYMGDGVVISTPTGSTAYAFSCGGPVVEPTLESIALSPICPHTLNCRSVIFGADNCLTVMISPESSQSSCFSCDGESPVSLENDNFVSVTKSDKYARFIRIKGDMFWDVLKQKIKF